MEVWDAMMGTRDAVNDWLEKRRQKARAEGIALGRSKLAAEANREPFDEPPPGEDTRQN